MAFRELEFGLRAGGGFEAHGFPCPPEGRMVPPPVAESRQRPSRSLISRLLPECQGIICGTRGQGDHPGVRPITGVVPADLREARTFLASSVSTAPVWSPPRLPSSVHSVRPARLESARRVWHSRPQDLEARTGERIPPSPGAHASSVDACRAP